MDALVKANEEPMGAEWFTAADFADHYGTTVDAAQAKLSRLTRAGQLERWKGTGRICRRTLTKYRPIVAKPLDKQR